MLASSMSEPGDNKTLRNLSLDVPPRSRPRVEWMDRGRAKTTVLEEKAVVGSASGVEIEIADRAVSRLHAELEPQADGLWVRDLGSLNGTLINGVRVIHARVPDGGTIRIGSTDLRVVYDEPAPPSRVWPHGEFGPLLGASASMRELFATLSRAAATASSVLVHGETGTGKELVARAIHDASPRAGEPFVVVDCAALPEPLLESELFGHARGAFTGAQSAHEGAFEAANGGTLFLDEIGELPLAMQPKLLRALESRSVRRVGETQYRAVDVRVVSATHRDLRQMVNIGGFREDLYFRLAVLPLTAPPLRDRPSDIIPLLERFIGRPPEELLGADVLAQLTRLPWLGNVRELRNFAERLLAFGPQQALALAGAGGEAQRPTGSAPLLADEPTGEELTSELKDFREQWMNRGEAAYVKALLERHAHNVVAAAKAAGVNRTHLYRIIKKHAL
jgi:transcriptional regulator with PAS, ATPase and Fis domain